ncbi:TetR/AcrR family transcriptional regulator [uncultured Jatrophihabitans sp.]|uniref:TetR/AcrR family transcriptional regulator n=1 Tax=uncultured Jatrophihabitans sp. TaxID=1610747 RepID=UPI0035CCA3E2
MTKVDESAAVDAVGASRPMRKDAARNRALLLTAARDVFRERGLDASLDDVAARAGVGVGTAYRHFANKHELARAVLSERIEEMIQLAESSAATRDAWQGITTFIEGAATAQTTDRGLREVLMGAHDPQQMEQIHDRMTGPLRGLVARGKTEGVLRDDVQATDVGVVMMMLCTVADVTADTAPDLWRRYLPVLLDGLRPGKALPVPPIEEDEFRAAMSTYKQRMQGAGG